jgi:hypothetical protein
LLSHPDDPSEAERSGKAVAADRLAAILADSGLPDPVALA